MASKKNQTAISDEELIAALLNSSSLKQAAEAAGIGQRTLYERMSDKDFQAAYNAAKSDIVRQAVFNINRKLTEAIETVGEIMTNKEVNASIRLQAAQVIINNAGKFADRLQADEQYTITRTAGLFSKFDF